MEKTPPIAFAYHMYGDSMGDLYLEVSTNDWSSTNLLWAMSGDQGNNWFSTNVALTAYAGMNNVYIRFRGVTGSSWMSDMALDLIVVSENPDMDEDGLPNDWETLYFGGPTNANPSAMASNGVNTVLETYIADLDPTDPDAAFLISVFRSLFSENILQWQNASGRVYTVYWTTNLLNGFILLQSNLTSGGFTDTVHGAEEQGFYKLDVQLAP